MKRLMIGMAAACAMLTAGAATEYYVDANNGCDDDTHDGSSWAKAKQTLSVACALATEEGDTVYVAEGDYKTGSDGAYRAKLAAGVKLIGVGNRDKIRIFGSATGSTRSTTPLGDDLRCIDGGEETLVKNVTLCNGRGYGVNGGAGSATYFVACVFSNNYVSANGVSNKGRGGALASGTAIRCLFKRNDSSSTGKCIYGGKAWNCVFDQSGETAEPTGSYVTHNTTTYNCTVTGTGGCSVRGLSHYNLLVRVVDGGSSDTSLYSSLYSGTNNRGNKGDVRTQFNVGLDNLPIDAEYRPLPGNIGIDYGSNLLYNVTKSFPKSELVADQKNLDFNGNPRIQGAAIDVGACEADPNVRALTIADAQTALDVTGAAKGETVLRYGETNTFTLARNYSTTKLCTGVNVNGTFFSFTGDNADKTYEYTYGYGDPVTNLIIEAVYAEHNDWYVNPNALDDTANGYTKYQAKKTLKAAMENPLLAADDTVHAAAGVYNGEPFGKTNITTNRVTVAADVGLVADEGPEVTAIEGEKKDPYSASIRCVGFADGNTRGYIKGFTLRNGSTAVSGYSDRGGGVNGGTAIDCVITNCSAVRGGGAYGGTLIRCRIFDCFTLPVANANAAGCYSGSRLIDSYVEDAVLDVAKAVNCTFGSSFKKSGSNKAVAYNCLAKEFGGGTYQTNCVEGTKTTYLDGNLRPKTVGSALVDAGDSTYYDQFFPTAFADEKGKDLAGGQRIYNGQIDIGCGEYDWRGEYTRKLGTRHAEVTAATAEVELVDDALTVGAGGTLTFRVTIGEQGGRVQFRTGGDGTPTVSCETAKVTEKDGIWSFYAPARTTHLVAVSAEGGAITVSDMKVPKRGIYIAVW